MLILYQILCFFIGFLRWRSFCKSLRNCQNRCQRVFKLSVQETGQIPACTLCVPVSMCWNDPVGLLYTSDLNMYEMATRCHLVVALQLVGGWCGVGVLFRYVKTVK